MFCTPPATTRSAVPDRTACAAKCTACWDEPHCRSTVVPGTCSGSPATSQQVRAMSPACGPTVSTHPKITSSTAAGSTPDRSISALIEAAPRSAGWTPASPPPRRPTGVRTASTMYASATTADATKRLLGRPAIAPASAAGAGGQGELGVLRAEQPPGALPAGHDPGVHHPQPASLPAADAADAAVEPADGAPDPGAGLGRRLRHRDDHSVDAAQAGVEVPEVVRAGQPLRGRVGRGRPQVADAGD